VRDALHASNADERREHEEAKRRHQTEFKRLQDPIAQLVRTRANGIFCRSFPLRF
jgi:hypothetical protein